MNTISDLEIGHALGEEVMQTRFAHWVGLLEPYFRHEEYWWEDGHSNLATIFDFFEVPEFWREPVRVMAQGACYYSADKWMATHVK